MGPVPEEARNNPADDDNRDRPQDSEELESPDIVPPAAADDSSDDNDDDGYSDDGEGPANDGYMLLPQHPEEEEGADGGGETFPSQQQQQVLPPLEEYALPREPMTEVRGAGVDVSRAVAEGHVHPAFAAGFPDNKIPVHLQQVPALPKAKKDDALWNHTPSEKDRLQLDSAQQSKVKLAMSGFQLPSAHIPDWARHVTEGEWKQHLLARLSSGTPRATSSSSSSPLSGSGPSKAGKGVASKERGGESEKKQ